MPDRRDVDLHRQPELVEPLLFDREGGPDPGVVDEHVDAAEPRHCLGDEVLAVRLDRQVRTDDERARQLIGELLEPVDAPRRQHHVRTDGVEHPGETVAETRRGSRDDCGLPVESEHVERVGRGFGHAADSTIGRRDPRDRVSNAAVA
jgi:hypothetical protein